MRVRGTFEEGRPLAGSEAPRAVHRGVQEADSRSGELRQAARRCAARVRPRQVDARPLDPPRARVRLHRRRGQPDARAEPPHRAGAGERPPQDGGRCARTSGADVRTKATAMAASARRYPASARCGILGAPRSTCYRMLAHPPRPKAPDPIEPDEPDAFGASRGGCGARRLAVLRVPARRPLQPRDSRLLVRAAQGRAAGQGRLLERGVPARRHRGLPRRQGVGVLQRGDRRAALGLRNRGAGVAPRRPLRRRGGRVREQGARAGAGARPRLRLGGAAQGGALRLGELVQQPQAALVARLYDARRVQGGGPDPLVDLCKKVLPYQPHHQVSARDNVTAGAVPPALGARPS